MEIKDISLGNAKRILKGYIERVDHALDAVQSDTRSKIALKEEEGIISTIEINSDFVLLFYNSNNL